MSVQNLLTGLQDYFLTYEHSTSRGGSIIPRACVE